MISSVHDPVADPEDVMKEFELSLVDENELRDLDCVILAVPHKAYLEKYDLDAILKLYRANEEKRVFVDIKSVFDKKECEERGLYYWSL